MKGCLFASLLLLITVAQGRAGETGFTQSVSEADFAAAGLQRLTPEERRHLDKLVAASQQILVADALRSAEEARAAKQTAGEALAAKSAAEAEAKVMKEAAKAAKHEAELSKAESVETKASKGFFAKAKVMIVPGTQIEYAEITSTVDGPFEGWNGRTIFRLANGQRWQVANSDERYFVPPQKAVEVAIRPAGLGGYWMYFPSLSKRVRVKLLGEK